MNRILLIVAAPAAALGIAACGATASGSTTTPAGAGNGSGFLRNAATGQLVQINGDQLILSNANGDSTVTYSSSTIIVRTSTGTVADIVPGVCLSATGQKDATGHVTASTVAVSSAVNGKCAGNVFGGGGGGPRRSPNPSFTPNPAFANRAVVRGVVTPGGVNGTSVTVQETNGTSMTISVPTTVRITTTQTATSSDLQTGECILATGQRQSSGAVSARSLDIVPAGPSGCFSGGGGFGGFGGGGFGGGGGIFGGGGGGTTSA